MQFGERVRELRESKKFTQKELACLLGVSISYISKVENEKLHFGDYPSEKFIYKLATELDADEDELLLLADKIPESIRKRIQDNPEAFRLLATMTDNALEAFVLSHQKSTKPAKR
ncbi:helix-turn-helix domain-containing protein [Gimesia sp.]|uniref:helix-turn-helix domain-containing protein n=1 Tax=Gimesia sp. TaxID=2024833 RepID=UPI003A8C8DD8